MTLFFSCSGHDSEVEENAIGGFYKIESIHSDTPVDLNGDSQRSEDLMTEIDYYFTNSIYDMDIRPNYTNDTDDKLISIYFPEPYLTFDVPSNPNGSVEYVKNGIAFRYVLQNGQLELDETENEFIVINNMELLGFGSIGARMSKAYYDFSTKKWLNLKLEIIYSKKDL
ncbi:MAG: hypothetical protein WA951_11405 [Leeuwenhoekiella sp.]